MKSNYRKIGDFIRLVDIRNKDLAVTRLVGLSITKEFIPSVANVTGTDMSKYKVIRKGQFACSIMQVRRDKKMPVALMTDFDEAIISQAYPVFEVIDEEVLLPEYLMMWFSRSEFDRHACFLAVGGVRGSLEWEDFLEMELPIPSIEKQRAIVAEYNTVVNRIQLNEELNQKLEETAQAIYKHWFVDFEFPSEAHAKNGFPQPYKSSGGKMVWNEELEKEIPEGWEVKELNGLCQKITKGTTPQEMKENQSDHYDISYIKGESINDNHTFAINKISFIDNETNEQLKRSQLQENDICYSIAGSLDKFTIVDKEILPANTNQAIAIIRVDENAISVGYIYGLLISGFQTEYYTFNIQQAVQANLSLGTIASLPLLVPERNVLYRITQIMGVWLECWQLNIFENRRLIRLAELMLSKMTKVKETTEKETI